MKNVKLGEKIVGDSNPCYFIAEIGGLFKNFEEAKRLIDSAVKFGADAIKFQTLEAETITTKNNYFNLGVTGKVLQYDFFKKFEPSKDVQKQIVDYANTKSITVFSAPSHIKDLELMEKLELPIYKIGSDLACHIPLLKKIAKLDKPIILSTGMCNIDEVKDSVNAILSEGNENLVILHCVSDYPTKPEETNLNVIQTLKDEFNLPIGYSDHTIGTDIPFAAAVLGANLIEKHFRHDLNKPSADDIHALTPLNFEQLIKSVKKIENSMGDGKKRPTESEEKNLVNNRVSIVSLIDIPQNAIITSDMIDVRRPGTGLAPKNLEKVIGKKAKKFIPKDEPIDWEMI